MAFTVFIVDDDPAVLKALSRLVRIKGYDVAGFTSPQDFLAHHDPAAPGCAVLDVGMPDLDGLQLQQALSADGSNRPIIFITGEGTVPTTVRAMKAGAIDFLTKPVEDKDLLDAIVRAERMDTEARRTRGEAAEIQSRLATLTPREREVLTHVVTGRLNKQIAGDLGTGEQTIKVHRSRMMEKLRVHNVATLMRLMAKVEKYDASGGIEPTVNRQRGSRSTKSPHE